MKTLFNMLSVIIFLSFIQSCSNQDSTNLAASSDKSGGNGQGGSLARFAIAGDYLYVVNADNLKAYDISNAETPQFKKDVTVASDIETIFPYNNMIFIGSRTGMLIYDKSDPLNPQFVSRYEHVQSCDPVVVQGNYAYVTLRSGTDCRFGSNLLDIIDISNPKNPFIKESISMINPHGLGVDGDRLFVCEGDNGLKVFDISKPAEPEQIQFIKDVKTYDVIPRNNLLIVTGKDGIFQYDYSGSTLKLLSQLK